MFIIPTSAPIIVHIKAGLNFDESLHPLRGHQRFLSFLELLSLATLLYHPSAELAIALGYHGVAKLVLEQPGSCEIEG